MGVYLNIPSLDGLIMPVAYQDLAAIIPLSKNISLVCTKSNGVFQTATPIEDLLDALEEAFKGLV